VQQGETIYCCAHCAGGTGGTQLKDRA
jgi:hypothetical protein